MDRPEASSSTGGVDFEGVAVGAEEARGDRLELRLTVTDAEVVTALLQVPQGPRRDELALKALRLGVLALRMAGGQLDAERLERAGEQILSKVSQLLTERAGTLTAELATALARYLDPSTGTLPQRLKALTDSGGELDKLLKAHLGADGSTLARSITEHVGQSSPLFKLLSPTEATGLKMQLEAAVKASLDQQRDVILQQFSLDQKGSALSRLVGELKQREEALSKDLQGRVDQVVGEFSLDKKDSALSRLVANVKEAQERITREFTLDNDASALFRLKRELGQTLETMAKRNDTFQTEVRETLAALQARKAEAVRGTQHGLAFEEQLSAFLQSEAQAQGDVHEPVGKSAGAISRCFVGDVVTRLGPESAAPGAGIVWEAKQKANVALKDALAELDEARRNRACQLGVFVYSKRTAPEGLSPFARYGSDLVVLWDAEDPTTDVFLKAAYSVARALAVRGAQQSEGSEAALTAITDAVNALLKQCGQLGEMKKWADTQKSNAEKISDAALKLQRELDAHLGAITTAVASLKAAGPGER